MNSEIKSKKAEPPMAILAELSHKCPLKCLYCSNPIDLENGSNELTTNDWQRVFSEAEKLGVLQVHLSGGEPLVRTDLEVLVKHLNDLDLYMNLVSSGIGLTQKRLSSLLTAGLRNIQMSIQAESVNRAQTISGVDVHESKLKVLSMLKGSGLHLTINIVIHALNIEYLESMVNLCTKYDAKRIELANCQYHGWALSNRQQLLPTRDQIDKGYLVYSKLKEALKNELELVWVYPDYYSTTPKPCMGGWAAKQLTISPSGVAMPCPGAYAITTMDFPNVRRHPLDWIWYESEGFNAYRGYEWMKEPCISCDKRFTDFGGCRCQAFALTGDARNTDPVCTLTTQNKQIEEVIEEVDHKNKSTRIESVFREYLY